MILGLVTFMVILGVGIVGLGIIQALPEKVQNKIDSWLENL